MAAGTEKTDVARMVVEGIVIAVVAVDVLGGVAPFAGLEAIPLLGLIAALLLCLWGSDVRRIAASARTELLPWRRDGSAAWARGSLGWSDHSASATEVRAVLPPSELHGRLATARRPNVAFEFGRAS